MQVSMSMCLPEQLNEELSQLANVTGRTKSFLAVEAVKEFIAREKWQIEKIQKGITEADQKDFATDEEIMQLNENWAKHYNRFLKTYNVQIDHRSYERQGIDKIPTIHEGYTAREMERNGKTSDRCQINRDIAQLPLIEQEKNLLENLKEKIINSIGNIYDQFRNYSIRRTDDAGNREIERRELGAFINGERIQKISGEERELNQNIKQPLQEQSRTTSELRKKTEKSREQDFGMSR